MEQIKTMNVDKERLRKICKKSNLNLVILFGSHATKKGIKKESDIDIGILYKKVENIVKNDLRLTQAFIKVLGNDRVDLIYLNYADPLLLFEMAKNGILLYQDKEDRFAEFKIKAIKRHLDAEKFYKLEDLCLERFLQNK
ncbi:MAG: nucleotidyltransferase domain-containing protein [Candidatus Aminicenantia bacterium]